MRVSNETSVWRDIVNQDSDRREAYNANSLNDYIDTVLAYYHELSSRFDVSNPEAWPHILVELTDLMDVQMAQCGEMGEIRVRGNGVYLPGDSQYFGFFDGSHGLAGDYAGFSISELPAYQNLLYNSTSKELMQPTLCIELSNYHEYSSTDIQLEARGDSVSIPIEGQDICFSRNLG